MSPAYRISPQLWDALDRWQLRSLLLGGILMVVSLIGAFINPGAFVHSYLAGFLLCLGLTLGSMAWLMLQYLTNGAWGVVARRVFEAATRTLPLVAVMFVPVAIGMTYLYPWAHPDLVERTEVLRHRRPYMNPTFFVVRAVLYFAIWMLYTYYLNRWSDEQDRSPGNQQRRLARLSAPGLIVYVFSVTFAAVDWAGSLLIEWYSTIWGFIFVANQGLTAMAFTIIVLRLLSGWEPLSSVLRPSHFHALGKLLLALLMVWAYFSFSQLLIVWAGNLPHEISFYLPRWGPPWSRLGAVIAGAGFLIPFLLLLSRPLKRNAGLLSWVAAWILVMRYVDLVWVVAPNYRETWTGIWTLFTTPAALVCIWLWRFLGELRKKPLLPLHAPNLEEALAYEPH